MNLNPEITVDITQPHVKIACAACSGEDLERFVRIPELPTNCVALATTRKAALDCAKGNIDLGFCRKCGAISNLALTLLACLTMPATIIRFTFRPHFKNTRTSWLMT